MLPPTSILLISSFTKFLNYYETFPRGLGDRVATANVKHRAFVPVRLWILLRFLHRRFTSENGSLGPQIKYSNIYLIILQY